MGSNRDVYASVGLWNSIIIKLYIKTLGATPKAIISLKLSNCFPYSLSTFKSLARSLKAALSLDPRQADKVASTKGTISG